MRPVGPQHSHSFWVRFWCSNEHSLNVFALWEEAEGQEKKAQTDIEWIVKAACCEVAQQPPGSCKLSYSIINKVVVSLEVGAHIWTLKSNTSYIQLAF